MWSVFACVFIYVSAQGFVFPNGSAIAMMRHGDIAGTASALLGTNQFLIAALTTTFLGFIDNPALPMAIVIAGSAVCSTLLNFLTLGAQAGDGAASGLGFTPQQAAKTQYISVVIGDLEGSQSVTGVGQGPMHGRVSG